jgi:hypothetical protein
VSLDELQEKIAEIEDFVQSTDVAAMQSTFLVASAVPCTETFLFRAVDGPRFISMVSSFWVLCEDAFGCICIILRGKSSLLVHTLCSTILAFVLKVTHYSENQRRRPTLGLLHMATGTAAALLFRPVSPFPVPTQCSCLDRADDRVLPTIILLVV